MCGVGTYLTGSLSWEESDPQYLRPPHWRVLLLIHGDSWCTPRGCSVPFYSRRLSGFVARSENISMFQTEHRAHGEISNLGTIWKESKLCKLPSDRWGNKRSTLLFCHISCHLLPSPINHFPCMSSSYFLAQYLISLLPFWQVNIHHLRFSRVDS